MARHSIFSTKGLMTLSRRASASEGSAVGRALRAPMTYRTPGVPYRSGWETEQAINDGLLRSIWTYKAVDAIARSGSGLPVNITKGFDPWGDNAVLDARTAPVLHRRLNVKASLYEFAIAFRYRLFTQLMVSTQGVFIEYAKRSDGEVEYLSLLSPDKTSPIPHPTKFVEGYEVYGADGSMEVLPADRVLWIKIPHPTDPYLSWTPLSAAGLSIDLDYYSRLYNRNFMANDGRPGGLASIKGPIPEEDERVIKERLRNPKPGEITVVEADAIDYKDLSTSPRDAAYSSLRQEVKDEILVAFGAPESVLGNASGRTYDNAEAEENIFWRMTMSTILRFVDLHLGSLTPGGDDDNLWVVHDTSRVQALQRPMRENEQRALEQFREGAIVLNEMREKMNLPTLGDRPGANTFFIPAGKVGISKTPEEQTALEELKAVGGANNGMAPGGAEQPALGGGNRIGAALAARRGLPARGSEQDPLQIGTARSTERVDDRRAIEANATERRREEKALDLKTGIPGDGEERSGHAVMIPVAPDKAHFLFRKFPLPITENYPHVTLGYFPKDEVKQIDLHLALAEWAARTAPFEVSAGPAVKSFDNGDERPLWLEVGGSGIHEAHSTFGESLSDFGIEFGGPGAKDYVPHMTMTYIRPGDGPVPQLAEPAFIRDLVETVTVSWADGTSSTYDLEGH